MNILKGEIESIKVNGGLSIVRVQVGELNFSTIVIDTPKTDQHLKKGNEVQVIFKETEVIIGVGNMDGISLRNKLYGEVVSIESDKLLSKIVVKTSVGNIISIITSNAVEQLQIKMGSMVTAMVKTNELMLSK
jgi:molybdate transport system regulatory protein